MLSACNLHWEKKAGHRLVLCLVLSVWDVAQDNDNVYVKSLQEAYQPSPTHGEGIRHV